MKVSMFVLENDRLVIPHMFKESYDNTDDMAADFEKSGFNDVIILTHSDKEQFAELQQYKRNSAESKASFLESVTRDYEKYYEKLPDDIKAAVTPLYEKAFGIVNDDTKGINDIFSLVVEALEMIDQIKGEKTPETTPTPEPTENKNPEPTEPEKEPKAKKPRIKKE